MAYLFGWPVRSIELSPEGGGLCTLFHTETMPHGVWMVVAAAGDEAARLAGYPPTRDTRDPDSDDAKMREHSRDPRQLTAARTRARALLSARQPAVEAVADALAQRGHVDGFEIAGLIDQAEAKRRTDTSPLGRRRHLVALGSVT